MDNKYQKVTEKEENGFHITVQEPNGWYRAWIKNDGCIEFDRFFNDPYPQPEEGIGMSDRIHICDIDDFIERLKALKEIVEANFK